MAADAVAARTRLPLPAAIGLAIGAAIMLAPLLWTLALSFKANAALVGNSGAALTAPWTLENYAAILSNGQTMRWLVNSLVVSAGTTLGVLILCSLAG